MSDQDNATPSKNAQQVLEAAQRLVTAFGEGQLDEYFACFHSEATFIFYTADSRLESTAQWRELWDRLEREDAFQILGCSSREKRVQDLGDTAVFTHSVETQVSTRSSGKETLHERETIVFSRQEDGSWLAVHEHLSPAGDV